MGTIGTLVAAAGALTLRAARRHHNR